MLLDKRHSTLLDALQSAKSTLCTGAVAGD